MFTKAILRQSFSNHHRCFSTAQKRVGFIGMGNMGLSMASNLMKNGFEVKGYDISEKSLEKAAALGITPVTSIKEVASDVDFVVSSLPMTQHVEEVLYQENGIFDSANEGTCIVDTSTISPIAVKEFTADAKKKGMIFCDTPMSGGVMGAANGTLTFMVGSQSAEDFETAKIVLQGMGKNIFNCGPPGTGQIAKITNNMILGIQMCAVSEGLAMGEKLGIEPKILSDILQVSTSNCWAVGATNPRPGVVEGSPSSNNYQGGFQVGLIRKDLALALECAKSVDAKTDFGEKALDTYVHLEKGGHGGKDFGYVFQYIMGNHKD